MSKETDDPVMTRIVALEVKVVHIEKSINAINRQLDRMNDKLWFLLGTVILTIIITLLKG